MCTKNQDEHRMENEIQVRSIFRRKLRFVFFHYYACTSIWYYPTAGDTLLFKMKLSVQIWVAPTYFAKNQREATV